MDFSGDRSGSQYDFLKQIVLRELADTRVMIPAMVDSFDPATQMIEATPMIRKRKRLEDGSIETEDMLKQIKVPMCTPYVRTLGFSLTLPVSPGDIVLFFFSDRALDEWQETGDISDTPETDGIRAHHLTDAIYMLGPITLPDAILDYQIDAMEMRNSDRTTRMTIWEDEAQVIAKPTNNTTWTSGGSIDSFAPNSISEVALLSISNTAGTDIESNAGGSIKETAIGDITSEALGDIEETATGSITSSAGGSVNISGATVTIQADGSIIITGDTITLDGIVWDTHIHPVTGSFTGPPEGP